MRLSILIGSALSLTGLALMLDALNVTVPLARTFVAAVLIYAGLNLLIRNIGFRIPFPRRREGGQEGTVIAFRQQDIVLQPDRPTPAEIDVVCGSCTLDVSAWHPGAADQHLDVGTVFGRVVIRAHPRQALTLRGDAVLGDVRIRDGARVALGDIHYRSPHLADTTPALNLHLTAVLGSIHIEWTAEMEKVVGLPEGLAEGLADEKAAVASAG